MENTQEFLTLTEMIQLEPSTSLSKFYIRDCDIKKISRTKFFLCGHDF